MNPTQLLFNKIKNQTEIKNKKYKGSFFKKSAPTNLLYCIRYRLDEIKDAYYRARDGYARWQAYDIKSWFAINITHLLHDMILDLHGHPCEMEYEEWKNILNDMYRYFKNSLNKDETDLDDSKFSRENLKCGLELFVKYFDHLWD